MAIVLPVAVIFLVIAGASMVVISQNIDGAFKADQSRDQIGALSIALMSIAENIKSQSRAAKKAG
ncbi:MAG: hypothetical protein ACOH15_04080 [Acetobacterium sp.]